MRHVDITIVGGGMIGLALACGLQGSGFHVAVLEKKIPPVSIKPNTSPTLRVSAINTASEILLRQFGVWSEIITYRVSHYHSIEVWDKDGFGHLVFDNTATGYNHLGCIIENSIIRSVLWKQARQCSDIILFSPTKIQQVVRNENCVFVTLHNGDMLTTKLLVGADGSSSWLRNKLDIPITLGNCYHHHALIATVRTKESHGAVARQIFHSDGILAFLPLSDPYLSSIVWSLDPSKAQYMLKINAKIFNKELCVAFDNCLGLCTLEGKRQVFPLTSQYALQFAGHRIVLIGDAAHTIHPLAGQGVNIGLMDVAELIGELRRLQNDGRDIGQYLYLRRYERRRKHSAIIMLAIIQIFHEMFDGKNKAKVLLRNVALRYANNLIKANPKIIRKAMGISDLPNWLR